MDGRRSFKESWQLGNFLLDQLLYVRRDRSVFGDNFNFHTLPRSLTYQCLVTSQPPDNRLTEVLALLRYDLNRPRETLIVTLRPKIDKSHLQGIFRLFTHQPRGRQSTIEGRLRGRTDRQDGLTPITCAVYNACMEAPELSPTRSKPWQPGLLSFLVHATLLVLAAFWVIAPSVKSDGGGTDRAGEIVLAQLTQDQESIEYEDQTSAVDAARASESIPQIPEALATPEIPVIERTTNDGVGPIIDLTDSANQMDQSLAANRIEHTLSDQDLEAIAREQRALASRQPQGPMVSSSLFGSGKFEGRRFVFVIDRSGSMGDSGLGVLFLARKELASAISALTPENHFQVLVYNDKVTMIGERNMLPGTEANKQRLHQFMASIAAFGATNHESGLYSALALRPDVIVWLADGGYPELNANQIRSFLTAAGKRVTIHSFEFGTKVDPPTNTYMQKLAEDSGGFYRYINVHEWKQQNQDR
jgi:hypothetical protein